MIAKSFHETFRIIGAAHYAVMATGCYISGPGRAETGSELSRMLDRRNLLMDAAAARYKEFTARRIRTLLECSAAALSSRMTQHNS